MGKSESNFSNYDNRTRMMSLQTAPYSIIAALYHALYSVASLSAVLGSVRLNVSSEKINLGPTQVKCWLFKL